MTMDLLLAVAAALGVALIGAAITLRLARTSMRWAAILSPVVVVAAIGAGLFVGVERMLIGGAETVLLVMTVVAPVALAVGIVVAARSHHITTETTAALAAERRRREVEQGRRELITWLSHDLRTPLAGIRAMGEALSDGVASDPDHYHKAIVAEADRTSAMVSDLMALAGLASGRDEAATEPVSVGDLASDLIGQLQPLAEAAELRLVGEPAAGRTEVDGDVGLIARALQNLIGNAIKYSQAGSFVRVRVESVDHQVRVLVTDGCGGLSGEERTHMFDAGWRKDKARTPRPGSGSGLGLPIVRAVAEAHGGTVTATDSPGGCTIALTFPGRNPSQD